MIAMVIYFQVGYGKDWVKMLQGARSFERSPHFFSKFCATCRAVIGQRKFTTSPSDTRAQLQSTWPLLIGFEKIVVFPFNSYFRIKIIKKKLYQRSYFFEIYKMRPVLIFFDIIFFDIIFLTYFVHIFGIFLVKKYQSNHFKNPKKNMDSNNPNYERNP